MNSIQSNNNLIKAYLLFGFGFLGISLGQPLGLAQLPISFFLKDHFAITASGVALIAAFITIPFYLKPIAGLITDTLFFKITQRQQVVWTSLIVALCWPLFYYFQNNLTLFILMLTLLVCLIVFVNTVFGGLFIEYGQKENITGELNAARITAEGIGVALAGLIGGILAGKQLFLTYLVCSLIFVFVALVGSKLKLVHKREREGRDLKEQINRLLEAKDLWLIILILFLVLIAPGIRTTLLYFQTDHLHFSKSLIGELNFVNGLSALLGAVLYAVLCKKVPVYKLLWWGICLYLITSLAFLFYDNPIKAFSIQALNGFALAMAALPVLDLATRSCPIGLEATSYGVILSVTNFTLASSDILGASLYSHGISFYNLVWINFATTLIAIPFLWQLPGKLKRI